MSEIYASPDVDIAVQGAKIKYTVGLPNDLGSGPPLFTWKAVVIALAVMVFPLLVRSLRTAFEEVPEQMEAAGKSLGGSDWRIFWKISLPLARRGMVAGIVLSFARALGEFGATVMVAGFIPGLTETLSLSIYRSVQNGDDPRAMLLVGVSALIAFGAVFVSTLLMPKRR